MDKIDRKILKELIKNSRTPLSKIGKTVRLSRENVYYRIQNMIKKKIIGNFITSINYKALGYNNYTIFIEFDKINKEKEEQIIKYLKAQNNIGWIGILSGHWSLTFDTLTKSHNELNELINKFFNKFNKNLGNYIILSLKESEYYFSKIINENIKETPKTPSLKKIKIDQIDLQILKLLNEDSRTTYVHIADKLKLTANTIKNRVKNLEKNKIIQGYSISINHKKFELEWNGLQIKIKKPSTDLEKRIKDYLKTKPEVIFYYHYNKSGIYDIDIGTVTKNSSELRDLINDLRSTFFEEILITDTFLVLEEISSHKLPEGIFLKWPQLKKTNHPSTSSTSQPSP